MLFSSMTFLFVFLPVTLAVYYLAPAQMRNLVMLAASLFFYAWGEPVYIILMLLSILMNYYCGLDIDGKRNSPQLARRSLIFAVAANVLVLGFFKYYGLIMETVNGTLPVDIPYRVLPLPIGISFYTFQALSYIVDVYRGEARAQKKFTWFASYICMFPQLIAGPIIRYVDIEEQLRQRSFGIVKFGRGAMFFIRGLAKKVVIANSIGTVYEQVMQLPVGTVSVLTSWVGCLAYAFQIYFDFSGYSDMAVGLGKMFGFEFRRNFHYPYVSKSITEFWRRWHISLSTWFREYVYIPLGGNRCGGQRNMVNLILVWALTGLWHGAEWNFLLWGLYYGVLLILEKHVWGALMDRLPGVIQHIYTFVLVMVGWVFFFSPDLGSALDYIGMMFGMGASALADRQAVFLLTTHWLLFLLCILGSSSIGWTILRAFMESYKKGRTQRIMSCVIYMGIFLVSVAFLVTETFNPFLYFRF
ncbi:MBOAT family protein [Schaedlerella sp.]|uniref:MBOAT family O-acyltransferase n=1 Tax=Schaedlerella sp. TaxID=2676057 RepID=UPI002611FD63|nr:MBOAT family O-acyltransferase [uncultured Schaedlerella sp.]MCI9329080.1 MBOAT family protein [Ruminococcus sp.]